MNESLEGKLAATRASIQQFVKNGLPLEKAEEAELIFLRRSLSPEELAQIAQRVEELAQYSSVSLSTPTDEQVYNRPEFPHNEFYFLSRLLKAESR